MYFMDYASQGKARRDNRARKNRANQTRIQHNGYLLIIQKDQRTGWQPHYHFQGFAIREGIDCGPVVICMPTLPCFSDKSDAIKYGKTFIDEKVSDIVYAWRSEGEEVTVV